MAADSLYQHLLFTAEKKFWRCVECTRHVVSYFPGASREVLVNTSAYKVWRSLEAGH